MKRLFYLLLTITVLTAAPAFGAAQNMGFLLSQVRTSTTSLAGGKVYFYSAGTSTPKSAWIDSGKATLAANPYTLDSNGTAQIYGEGIYRIVIKDASGVTKFDRDNLKFEDKVILATVTDYTNLADAVSKIGSTPTTLIVGQNQTMTGNLTIPSTLEIMPINGATITTTGYTLTYNSNTSRWPSVQIFGGSGNVAGLSRVEVAWFYSGSGTHDAALTAAMIAARANVVPVMLMSQMNLAGPVALIRPVILRGVNGAGSGAVGYGTIIQHVPTADNTDIFQVEDDPAKLANGGIEISDVAIKASTNGHASRLGIDYVAVLGGRLKNVSVSGIFSSAAVHLEMLQDCRIDGLKISNNDSVTATPVGLRLSAARHATVSTTTVIADLYVSGRASGGGGITDGIEATDSATLGITFERPVMESLSRYGLNAYRNNSFDIISPYSENVPNADGATPIIRAGMDGSSSGYGVISVFGGRLAGVNDAVSPGSNIGIQLGYFGAVNFYGTKFRGVGKLFEASSAASLAQITMSGCSDINDVPALGSLAYPASLHIQQGNKFSFLSASIQHSLSGLLANRPFVYRSPGQNYYAVDSGTLKTNFGTVSATNGVTTVVGTGGVWDATYAPVGLNIIIGGVPYVITARSPDDGNHITLDRPYEGATASGLSYAIRTGALLTWTGKAWVDSGGAIVATN